MIVQAAPGVGKSTFALEWGVHLSNPSRPGGPLPVLYLSLDTALQDQAARLVARWLGKPLTEVQSNLAEYVNWLSTQRLPFRFSDVQMVADEVRELVEAERLWFGRYPKLIVVDNAGDLIPGEESRQEYARVFNILANVARDTGAVVMALHHIKRGDEELTSGRRAPGMGAGMYAGEGKANILLGLWRPSDGYMNVSVVKNRMGQANPAGRLYVTLRCDLGLASVWEEQAA